MKALLDVLSAVGGILGGISFFWRIWDEFGSYLILDLEIKTDVPGYAVAVATVENTRQRTKALNAAFLLIGPFDEDPVTTYNEIAASADLVAARFTNDILSADVSRQIVIDEGRRQLIPLTFFTSENVSIGDERLHCCVPIKLAAAHYSGPHSVRLLISGDSRWFRRLHRSVHDVILVDPTSSPS